MAKILVIGATGYVGRHLIPKLTQRGHHVRALVRDKARAPIDVWGDDVELVEADVLKPETLPQALKDIEVVFYLVHSMSAGTDKFEKLDKKAAENTSRACKDAGVHRIIYLGGLGSREDEKQSTHLRSRHEVGNILRESGILVTEFRAAILIGTESFSFEMIHHLVNRLPVMVSPRWVQIKTQPIATGDALRYFVECLDKPESVGKIIDIGGPDVLSYYDMMMMVARVLRLRRFILRVPVLTPRLSSYWIRLVTPLSVQMARSIIGSLKSETVVEDDLAKQIFDFEPMAFEEAVRRALRGTQGAIVRTEAAGQFHPRGIQIDPSHLQIDQRNFEADVPAEKLYATVSRIGGDNGYFYADWLWRLRGWIDKMLGGIGMRKGRRHPTELEIGDPIDFWRVEDLEPGKKILLRAEMNLWGQGWMEYLVEPLSPGRSRLTQTMRYYPRGLWGFLYWKITYPMHMIIFKNMAKAIVAKAH
ncbi:MAG TPA: SDR family oxidoreductase [candidate division Zixibacteria bacterium]|nr:SDR family oxidoreductase [candidate division Zixibacteria bacterium]HEQ99163.1 SDR family oxidoreductase [candidate division Zixibacteria bacterium]